MDASLRVAGTVPAHELGRVAVVARFATLEDVVRWPGGELVEVVVQDEFTHDVVVRTGKLYVCFDTT